MTMQHDETCDKCPWAKYGGHKGIRALTAVIVLIFVFWCGFQFGEIRAMVGAFHNDYGPSMMRGDWNTGATTRVMYSGFSTGANTPAAPATQK